LKFEGYVKLIDTGQIILQGTRWKYVKLENARQSEVRNTTLREASRYKTKLCAGHRRIFREVR
jgi:hypothetical protein